MQSAVVSLTVLTALAQIPSAAFAQWGTIKGQVTVTGTISKIPPLIAKGDGAIKNGAVCAAADIPDESLLVDSKSGGLSNVFIWLSQKPASIHPDAIPKPDSEVTVRIKGCRFVPHVSLVQTNQRVRIARDDAIGHFAHANTIRNKYHSLMPSPVDADQVTVFKQPELVPVTVSCDIHPWMNARWLIVDHPYSAVTNESGEFEVKNLPVGSHEFRVWHEKAGYLEKSYKVTIAEGDNKLQPIEVKAETFMK